MGEVETLQTKQTADTGSRITNSGFEKKVNKVHSKLEISNKYFYAILKDKIFITVGPQFNEIYD